MIKKHNLIHAFPEFEEKIHTLKNDNPHFKKLFEEYDELDHEIYRIESDAEPASDDTLNHKRSERVKLKDEIYRFLKEN
ncbi:YdcH family protein [Algoriphagus sediminis]|uniref:YdcH family protein n=1 Tax=Algoriphagus sediminis TaxID=3057113 RepID=A0ABT7Y865_9BACT|nr:YdcH family protein [Algoriphagus sediminis]MDN3202650.1 YdcH family protein [Algoriphagus sediminis]